MPNASSQSGGRCEGSVLDLTASNVSAKAYSMLRLATQVRELRLPACGGTWPALRDAARGNG